MFFKTVKCEQGVGVSYLSSEEDKLAASVDNANFGSQDKADIERGASTTQECAFMLILQVFIVHKNIILPMFVLNLKYVVENMEFLCSVILGNIMRCSTRYSLILI